MGPCLQLLVVIYVALPAELLSRVTNVDRTFASEPIFVSELVH